MRHMLVRAMAPVIGMAILGIASASQGLAAEPTKINLRLAWIAGAVDIPLFVAASKGYFKDEGLDVNIVDGNGSTGTIQAVGSGDFEIGIAGLGALAQAQQAAGADTLIAVAGLLQKDPTSVISLKGSGITQPKDIEGKRFGTDAANFEDGMIKAFAEANGVDFSKVNVIIINGNNDRVALLKGDVDFINGWANPDGDKVAAKAPIEKPLLFADYGVNLLGSSVIVRKDFLAKNEAAVRGFLAALQKGKAATVADQNGAFALFMKARPDSDEAEIKLEMRVMPQYEHTAASAGKPYGWVAQSDVEQTISLLEKYSGMKPGLKPDSIYNGSYLPASN
ncbi:ABC transporter substrate-binding protein [Pleomorphomonas sp. PLEO]|uniref:ABC transporter substrate-binding protein n=1 Tax=Pleomorphomonas sp. PLEO TaxID=3239306 RepID=UPI00351E251B